MTIRDLRTQFHIEFPELMEKGLHFDGIFTLGPGIMSPVADTVEANPSAHQIFCSIPFIFDYRKLPKIFLGFKMSGAIPIETIPEEFRLDEEGLLTYEECWSEARIIAYAEEHALDICEQLNDYTLTLKDLCDIIAGGDFERHKKELAKILEQAEEEEEDDFDEE